MGLSGNINSTTSPTLRSFSTLYHFCLGLRLGTIHITNIAKSVWSILVLTSISLLDYMQFHFELQVQISPYNKWLGVSGISSSGFPQFQGVAVLLASSSSYHCSLRPGFDVRLLQKLVVYQSLYQLTTNTTFGYIICTITDLLFKKLMPCFQTTRTCIH